MTDQISTSPAQTHESLTHLLVTILNEAGVEKCVHNALRCFTAVPGAGNLPLVMVHGRVSSGKSSLINALLGDDILPVSSVPSSVVPVFIGYGATPAATAHFAGGDFKILDGAGLYHACTGKMPDVAHITITLPSPFLKPGLILVDTPPFDHHDPQVRKLAQLLLGQGDLALLLLEYDLINTEQNRRALHAIMRHGIPVAPTVTQIDRHDDRRPLAEFTSGAASWLELAGGDRSNLRFISIRQMKGVEDLQNLVYGKAPMLAGTIMERREGQTRHLVKAMEEGLGLAESKQIELSAVKASEKADRIAMKLQALKELPTAVTDRITTAAENALHGMLPSEYLQAACSSLIESCTPVFRMGILNRESQRQQERQKRLSALLDEVETYSEKEVMWHVRQTATKEAEALYSMGTAGKKALSSLSITLDGDLLLRLAFSYAIRPDGITAFPKAVVKQITDAAKNRLDTIVDVVRGDARDYVKGLIPQLESELDCVKKEQESLAAELLYYSGKKQLLGQLQTVVNDLLGVTQMVPTEEVPLSHYVPPDEVIKVAGTANLADESFTGPTITSFNELRYRLLGALQRATHAINQAPGAEAAETINRRIERIKGERFTFAIIGPPASGKAALANALAGRTFLPEQDVRLPLIHVSAAENGEHARVLFKDPATVALELETALAVFGYGNGTQTLLELAALLAPIATEVAKKGEPGLKGQVDYLAAAAAGLEDTLPLLGTEIEMTTEELRSMPGHAWHFMSEIRFEGPSEFLSQGITLRISDESDLTRDGGLSAAVAATDGVIILFPFHHVAGSAIIPAISRLRNNPATPADDPCFFVVNGADSTSGTAKELHEVEKRTKTLLEEAGIANPRTLLVSADLYLMAAGFSQGTQNLQLLHLYKRLAICDRNSHFPDPSANRDASRIPALIAAVETRAAAAKSVKIIADGCAITIAFMENLLAGKHALLRLMLEDAETARAAAQRRIIAASDAKLTLSAMKEELNGGMEHVLKKMTEERQSLLNEAREALNVLTQGLMAELFATIDPGLFTPDALASELRKRAAQVIEELSMALSFEQQRASLHLFSSFMRHARRIEEKGATRVASVKEQFYTTVMGDRVSFSGNGRGIAAGFPFERFSSAEFSPAEVARELRNEFDFVNAPEKIVGSIRSAIQRTISAELATLFLAMDLDLADMVESRAGDFLQRLLIYLERDLESFTLNMQQTVLKAEEYFAAERSGKEEELDKVEREAQEIEEQITLLHEIVASIEPASTETR